MKLLFYVRVFYFWFLVFNIVILGRKKNKQKKYKQFEREEKPSKLDLHPKTQKFIWGIFLVALSLLILFSFFRIGGILGNYINNTFSQIFGSGRFILPIFLWVASFIFFTSPVTFKRNIYWTTGIGSLVMFLSILGILDIFTGASRWGGYLGNVVAYPFMQFLGFWGSQVVFLTSFLIGFLVAFNFYFTRHKEKEPREPEIILSKEKKGFYKGAASFVRKLIPRKASTPFKIREIGTISPAEGLLDLEKFLEGVGKDSEVRVRPKVRYSKPSLELLEPDRGEPTSGDIKANSNIIKRTLQNFGIEVEMGEVSIGPTVTQYTLKPAEGVKLSKITVLTNDLSLALAAHPLRIEAPIPGKSLVGIEVPNKRVKFVRLRDLFQNPNFSNSPSMLTFALGRDVAGNALFTNLEKMPHILIAGSTGSGKTIALNSLILSLIYRNSPKFLRFILIDPKRVEFPVYNDLPHLLTPVITDIQKTINALKWLVMEMERRFEVLSEAKARDIIVYNSEIAQKLKEGEHQFEDLFLPYTVLIVDELADLMAARPKEIEVSVVRLAQMARAVGIHLVVATQRPSVEVITGLIKANITTRIAFQVASQVDSRTILDMAGAEKLLGNGDMLYLSAENAKPKRIQGAYVSEKEIKRVVDFLRRSASKEPPEIREEILEDDILGEEQKISPKEEGFMDPLYGEAKKVIRMHKKASASLLQRRLSVGYARAARLLDLMEEEGIVGPAEGAKPRKVYIREDTEENN